MIIVLFDSPGPTWYGIVGSQTCGPQRCHRCIRGRRAGKGQDCQNICDKQWSESSLEWNLQVPWLLSFNLVWEMVVFMMRDFLPAAQRHHWLFFIEVTLEKMAWKFWHQFLTQFLMLLQMVPLSLLCMVALSTITWLVEVIQTANQETFVLVALKAAIERKKKGTIWKSNKNWVRNWCQKWQTILLTATNQDNKQWHGH